MACMAINRLPSATRAICGLIRAVVLTTTITTITTTTTTTTTSVIVITLSCALFLCLYCYCDYYCYFVGSRIVILIIYCH